MSYHSNKNEQTLHQQLNELEVKVLFLEKLNRALVRALARTQPLDEVDVLDALEQELSHASDVIAQTSPELADVFDRYLAELLGEQVQN